MSEETGGLFLPPSQHPPADRALPIRSATILVVECKPDILPFLESRLPKEFRGYAIRWVPTAEKAIQIAMRESPKVVVVDYRLSGMDGIALLQRLRRVDASILGILRNTLQEPLVEVKAFEACGAHVVPGGRSGELVEIIQLALSQNSVV